MWSVLVGIQVQGVGRGVTGMVSGSGFRVSTTK